MLQRRHRQQGITIIEFSIAASVFFLLLFAVMEFSRLMYTFHLIQEATRSAARVAIVSAKSNKQDPLDEARKFLPNLDADQLHIKHNEIGGKDGTPITEVVTVTITGDDIDLAIPIPGGVSIAVPNFSTTQIAESLGK